MTLDSRHDELMSPADARISDTAVETLRKAVKPANRSIGEHAVTRHPLPSAATRLRHGCLRSTRPVLARLRSQLSTQCQPLVQDATHR